MAIRFTKDDVPDMAKLGGIFVAVGVLYGLISGDGIILGAVAGALLFGFMIAIGWLASLGSR